MSKPTPIHDGHKPCSRCKQVKPLDQFGRRYDNRSGYVSACNACEAARSRKRYQDPEERAKFKVLRDRWFAERPGYLAENYRQNREKRIADAAAYRAAHPRPAERPEWQRERDRERYRSNPEQARDKARRSNSRRRARLAGLPFERYTLEEILERDGINCVLCGEELDLDAVAPDPWMPTVEHLECISWPGSAGDVFSNVAAAHSRCNSRRHSSRHPAAARKRAELLAIERAAT